MRSADLVPSWPAGLGLSFVWTAMAVAAGGASPVAVGALAAAGVAAWRLPAPLRLGAATALAAVAFCVDPSPVVGLQLLLPVLVGAATGHDARTPLVHAGVATLVVLAMAARPGAGPELRLLLVAMVGATLAVVTVAHDRRRQALQWGGAVEALREDVFRDELTGLLNRRGVVELGEATLRRASGAALLYVDVDGLKAVNDRGGHSAGDALLREVAHRLRDVCRRTDLVARLGGDEFAVLLPGASLDDAERVATMLRTRARGRVGDVAWSVSIGLSEVGRDRAALETALDAADRRMYDEKRARKAAATTLPGWVATT